MEQRVREQLLRILVVEDEDAHAELICRAFEAVGHGYYAVTVARSLKEARAHVDAVLPDLVIADLLLPDGRGTELLADPGTGDRIPLIVMTSHGNEQAAVDALKGGALDYVVKSGVAFLDMPRTAERGLREWRHIAERKKAEQELTEREEELFAIYANAPLVMMLVDKERRVRKLNMAATTFAGRSAAEMLGLRGGEALRCVHSIDVPQGCGFGPFCKECPVRRTVMDTFETGQNHHQVEACLPFSVRGTKQELLLLLSTARLNVRQQPMVLVSILDITARKRMEEELRIHHAELEIQNEELRETQYQLERSRDNYSELYDFAPVGYFTVDEKGYILEANLTAAALLGTERRDLIQTPFSRFVCEEEGDNYYSHLMRALETHAKHSGEFRLTKRDGTRFYGQLESITVQDSEGRFRQCRTVLVDITARKQAEEALRESDERFRAVFESAEECILVKDHSLRYTHVNSAMCRLLGVPASEIVGRRAQDLYDPETARQLTDVEARALAGESIEIEQTRSIRGASLTFHDAIVPLRNEQEEIIGICCISRDITERKKLVWEPGIGDQHYPSPAMRSALNKALSAARTDSIVLLQGESGSGKDYLARWLHDRSKRAGGPFLSINCSALPRELAESELFGHERGAFTGAVGMKRGLLELAEGGTILLNEIGELDVSLQAKLLTFLDTHSFLRVGGQKHVQANARIIAATHRDLEIEVAERRFMEPLFYRLSVFPLRVPPLRDRPEDIPVLVREIMARLVVEMQLATVPRIGSSHINALCQYHWPGNVRELRNVLERSLMLWQGGNFDLAMPVAGTNDDDWAFTVRYERGKTVRAVTDEVKTFLCAAALDASRGNKREAARLLDVSRDAFYRYLKMMTRQPKNKTF